MKQRHEREAARRAAAQDRRREAVRRIDRPSASRVDVLERIAAELVELERDRLALLVRRDELVDELRAGGVSWGRLARLAGTSRQALMKRATPEKR